MPARAVTHSVVKKFVRRQSMPGYVKSLDCGYTNKLQDPEG
jgi:hypothetical protein